MSKGKSNKRQRSRERKGTAVPTGMDPLDALNTSDPGDATGRNFRYQYAYGAILILAAKRGDRPYVAIWCEHHEDFLAERTDSRQDAYQVKTSRPEQGAWSLSDADFVKSIGRFVDLVTMFGERIADLYFVSNTECAKHHQSTTKAAQSPVALVECARQCKSHTDMYAPFDEAFANLQAQCGCDASTLFAVLQRLNLVLGPSRSDFDAVISHDHLGRLDSCRQLTAQQLDQCRDSLVALVHRASTLQVSDPMRHLQAYVNGGPLQPALIAKRLDISTISIPLAPAPKAEFKFPGTPTLSLGGARSPTILKQKFENAGLADQLEVMRERELAAEYYLMEDLNRRPDAYPELLRQLEQVVLGECSEAHLRAKQAGSPYGPKMLIDVQDRLRGLAENRKNLVGNQDYECLIGVAGLLTSDCRVWWSDRFSIASPE